MCLFPIERHLLQQTISSPVKKAAVFEKKLPEYGQTLFPITALKWLAVLYENPEQFVNSAFFPV